MTKQYCSLTLHWLLILISYQLSAQPVIDYGSNDGNYLSINGTDIYYEEYGSGIPTILLHGGLGSISNFKSVIPGLSGHYKLYAIDSPGHGRSQSIDSMSYRILAEYIVKFVTQLALERVNIIGYSDGAIIGMLVAQLAPERIDKLVFGAGALSPYASTPEGLQLLQSISPEILPEDFANNYRRKSPDPDHWEDFFRSSKAMWLNDVWIPEESLPKTDCRVLVLCGDRDPFIPLSHSIEIHDALPSSELCVLPDTGHEIYNVPDMTLPVLIRFLSSQAD